MQRIHSALEGVAVLGCTPIMLSGARQGLPATERPVGGAFGALFNMGGQIAQAHAAAKA